MSEDFIATIRDLSIIFLALESIVVLILLSILIVQIRALVILLNEEIKPMLEATQETADSVRYTTNFVTTRVSKPFVDIISIGAGVRQAARTFKDDIIPPRNVSTDSTTTATPPASDAPPPAASSTASEPAPSDASSTLDGTDPTEGVDNG